MIRGPGAKEEFLQHGADTVRPRIGIVLGRANRYARARMRTLLPIPAALATLALFCCRPISAAELGEPQAELLAKHGQPQRVDSQGLVYYQWEAWTLGVQFVDGVAGRLEYEKTTPLAAADVLGVLTANGGQPAWTKTGDRLWTRSDGATATLEEGGLKLVLVGSHRLTPPPPVAVRVEAPAPVRLATTPPTVTVPNPTPPLMAPPKPFRYAGSQPTPVRPNPAPPKSHFWLMLFSWVPPLLLALFGKYAMKRQAKPRVFGPSDVIYPTPTIGPAGEPVAPSATIDSVSWDQFELVIAEAYRRQGYMVEVSSGLGADGGIDVKLTKDGANTLIQCKQWKTWKVKVPAIREFYGVLTSEGVQRGIFITTGTYTRDCYDFAKGKPIELFTRPNIDQLIRAAERPGENLWNITSWIEGFVAGARIMKPDCPFCHQPMVLRHTKKQEPLWGCPSFPRCRGKRNVRPELLNAIKSIISN